LLYDGSTEGLVAAMGRLLDERALRERLSRPVAVADRPLGAFYDAPVATQPLASEPCDPPPSTLVLLLAGQGEAGSAARTRQALLGIGVNDECIVSLREDGQGGASTLRLLGRLWACESPGSSGCAPPRTREALVVLRAGDVPDESWWPRSCQALANPLAGAFAGTWGRRGGMVEARLLDLCPERYPFEYGTDPTRVLMRTDPGVPIDRLFDDDLGPLGEVGYLWQAVRRWGPGVVLPRPLMELAGRAEAADESSLKFLVLRHGDVFADRLALWAGLLDEEVRTLKSLVPEAPDGVGLSADQRRVIAAGLDGRTLASLAWGRLRRHLREDPGAWLRRTVTSLIGR